MDKFRDLIYVNYDEDLKKVISYGIEFREFMQSLSNRPQNMLVLQGHFGSEFNFTTNCEYCISDDMDEFIKEDVYSYGNFSWIDFESVEGLEALTPQEVAELFYISKMWKPVNSTYFKKLNNRFVYNAHDDGWINHIFYNDILDFQEILEEVIIYKIKGIYNIELDIVGTNILSRLCELSKIGIAIDLLGLCVEDDNSIVIPIYQIGKFDDMDKMYDLIRESEVEIKLELRFNGVWELVDVM